MTDDGWQTVWFGKPYLISLFAAPAVAVFGADGFLATNMALLMLSIWMGTLYLRRFNPDGLALLFSAGFFLLSNAFAYVFWIHTEVLCMASVTACLYLAFTPASLDGADQPPRAPPLHLLERRQPAGLVGSSDHCRRLQQADSRPAGPAGPLPRLSRRALARRRQMARRRRSRRYRGLRHRHRLHRPPVGLPRRRALGGPRPRLHPNARAADRALGGLQGEGPRRQRAAQLLVVDLPLPEVDHRLPENAGYFFVGRHTGLLLYAPFSGLCLLLFFALRPALAGALGGPRRARRRRPLLPHPDPVQLARRRRLHRQPLLRQRTAGAAVPRHAHRSGLAAAWPVSRSAASSSRRSSSRRSARRCPARRCRLTCATLPSASFRTSARWRGRFRAIADRSAAGSTSSAAATFCRSVGESLWAVGGKPVELWVHTDRPSLRPVFQVESPSLRTASPRARQGPQGDPLRVRQRRPATRRGSRSCPGAPNRESADDGSDLLRLQVVDRGLGPDLPHRDRPGQAADRRGGRGARPAGRRPATGVRRGHLPGRRRGDLPRRRGRPRSRRLPARVAGRKAARRMAGQPPGPRAGDGEQRQPCHLAGARRDARGARLSLARQRRPARRLRGAAHRLPGDVAPGESVEVELEIATPRKPGEYILELDALREQLAWFSGRDPGSTLR
jgi:hypothetical protein